VIAARIDGAQHGIICATWCYDRHSQSSQLSLAITVAIHQRDLDLLLGDRIRRGHHSWRRLLPRRRNPDLGDGAAGCSSRPGRNHLGDGLQPRGRTGCASRRPAQPLSRHVSGTSDALRTPPLRVSDCWVSFAMTKDWCARSTAHQLRLMRAKLLGVVGEAGCTRASPMRAIRSRRRRADPLRHDHFRPARRRMRPSTCLVAARRRGVVMRDTRAPPRSRSDRRSRGGA